MNDTGLRVFPDIYRQLSSLPFAVVLLEPGLLIGYVNPAAEQFLGQSLRLLDHRRLTDVMSFSDEHITNRISDSESPISAREITAIIRGLGARRVDMTIAPVADSPGWQIMTLHDNSAIEALGDDSGAIDHSVLRGPEILAHEIKNPLAGIRGAAQLLSRKISDKDKALTDLIASEVDRIASLIEQMQMLSGRTVPPVEPCNLHQITRRAIAVLGAADGGSKTEFAIQEEFDPSLPQVMGNPDGLVQILINLLSNAREACQTIQVPKIIVRTRFASGLQLHTTDSGKTVRLPVELRVSDNGPGVDPAMRDHIFEPFVTTKKAGQGLGLPLVRKLVRGMNGRISQERDEIRGMTHFRIHLPLADEEKEPDLPGRSAG